MSEFCPYFSFESAVWCTCKVRTVLGFLLLFNFLNPNVFDPPVQYLQKKYISFIYYETIKVSMFSVLVLMEYNITKPLFEALNVQL